MLFGVKTIVLFTATIVLFTATMSLITATLQTLPTVNSSIEADGPRQIMDIFNGMVNTVCVKPSESLMFN